MAEEKDTQQPKPFRGLYRNVNISVKALDWIIAACIAVIVIVVAFNLMSPGGYTVTFDSRGGTDVEAQHVQYGELLPQPASPTREGYVFSGWFREPACDAAWDFANDSVEQDQTLYAGWSPAN